MRYLSIFWFINCVWRSIFPALYLQRFVFYDIVLNSILVNRTFAFIGEMCWISQIVIVMISISYTLNNRSLIHRIIKYIGYLSIYTYFIAELMSYYNTATKNQLWCVFEIAMDSISLIILFPSIIYLVFKCKDKYYESNGKKFLIFMSLFSIIYPLYNFSIMIPMYLERYKQDTQNNTTYLNFWDGIKDAGITRIKTHDFDDWKDDCIWMFLYFYFGSIMGLWMMTGPTINLIKIKD